MSVRTLGSEGGGFGRGLTSIGERNECQRGRWALNGWGGEQNTLYKGVETFL